MVINRTLGVTGGISARREVLRRTASSLIQIYHTVVFQLKVHYQRLFSGAMKRCFTASHPGKILGR